MRGSDVAGRPSLLVCAAALAAASVAGGAARAQSLEDRLRAQLVAVTAQLRQAQATQADLSAQKAAAEKDRDALKAKLAAGGGVPRRKSAAPAGVPPAVLAAARAEASQAQEAAAQARAQLEAARAESARLQSEAAALHAEGVSTATRAGEGAKALAACQAKNAQALALAKEVLDAYARVTVAGVLARKEPFTGLKRVQIETLEQDYADRLYDSRLDVTPPPPPSAPPSSAPAAAPPSPTPASSPPPSG